MTQSDNQGGASRSETAIVSSSHLADSAVGWQLSELEYAMTMTYNAFSRWMMHCMKTVGYKDFNPLDILIMHNINHREKEKRLADIAFMLNIEDTHTVNYAVKKLVKAGLVKAKKPEKRYFIVPRKEVSRFVWSMVKSGLHVCWKQLPLPGGILMKSAMSRRFLETPPVFMIRLRGPLHPCNGRQFYGLQRQIGTLSELTIACSGKFLSGLPKQTPLPRYKGLP